MFRSARIAAVVLLVAGVGIGCEAENGSGGLKGVAPKPIVLDKAGVETTDAFSYAPPAGWQMLAVPGSKYRMACKLSPGGVAPSMTVTEETYSGPLADYVNRFVGAVRQAPLPATILKDEAFRPASGVDCRRVVLETMQNATRLRQSLYFFANGDRKFVVACTTQADGGEALDPVFESSMATLRVAAD